MEVFVFLIIGLVAGWIFVGCPNFTPRKKYKTIISKREHKKLLKKQTCW